MYPKFLIPIHYMFSQKFLQSHNRIGDKMSQEIEKVY
jgi:hypothetical protein